ncbi:uracil phosphoribosyltransferase-domain-containing protein [Syncephalis plumigaleata]|nr:uracil phosphoribosyltransferase-domain-containing protein [Syncephalis plumigaleata]
MASSSRVHISSHPLVAHKMSILRDQSTPPKQVRELIHELTQILLVEATQSLATVNKGERQGPLQTYTSVGIKDSIAFVPVMRSGLGMVDASLALIPSAQVYHLGIYREKLSLQPVEYYNKLPAEHHVDQCIILDPMIATGGTALAAVHILKDWGIKHIQFISVCASKQGLDELVKKHPDVIVHVGTVDDQLNEHGYVIPGIGDTGDRLYNTLQ